MFASKITSTVTVGANVVTIAKLSWKKLREASEANTENSIGTARMVGPELMQAFNAMGDKAERNVAEQPADRYKAYDREKVLFAGIRSWTDTAVKVSPESICDLESDAADAIFRAIIDLSIPEKEVAEAQRGESSGASTGS